VGGTHSVTNGRVTYPRLGLAGHGECPHTCARVQGVVSAIKKTDYLHVCVFCALARDRQRERESERAREDVYAV